MALCLLSLVLLDCLILSGPCSFVLVPLPLCFPAEMEMQVSPRSQGGRTTPAPCWQGPGTRLLVYFGL